MCVCDYCGKGFSLQKYLDSHMTNKHPEKSEINSFIDEQAGDAEKGAFSFLTFLF